MKSIRLLVIAAAFVCSSHLGWAKSLSGIVVGITDGDTVTVLVDNKPEKVRVAGIDAPEKRQAFGSASKKALSECAFDKDAVVEWRKRDRYKRIVGMIMVQGVDCGLRQIQLGMAWHYKAYAKEQLPAGRQAYARAEDEARSDKTGLWQDSAPTPPWLYRHPKNGASPR